MQGHMLYQRVQNQIHVPVARKSNSRRIGKETGLAYHCGISLAWPIVGQRQRLDMARPLNKGARTDGHAHCLGQLDADDPTADAKLEHLLVASRRLQLKMMVEIAPGDEAIGSGAKL